MIAKDQWLDWAVEIQSLAQAGLAYGQNPFDIERYTRLRAIAAEMVAAQTDLPLEKVQDLFCGETGYQTPKVDTRAAVFQDGKILLVQEQNGTWALPGGWCDGQPIRRRQRRQGNAGRSRTARCRRPADRRAGPQPSQYAPLRLRHRQGIHPLRRDRRRNLCAQRRNDSLPLLRPG